MLAQTNEYASDLHNIGIVHHPEHVCSKSDDSGVGGALSPPLKSIHSYVLAQTNEYASALHNIGLVHHPEHLCKKSDDSGVGGSFEPPIKVHAFVCASTNERVRV